MSEGFEKVNLTAKARRGDYSVSEIPHKEGEGLVKALHYTKGCSRTSVLTTGLFRGAELVGVSMWLPPMRPSAGWVEREFGVPWRNVICLSRFVVSETEPLNAESLFLGRTMRMFSVVPRLRRWGALLTYADQGQGHRGTIYKATNWTECGVTKPRPVWVSPQGVHVSVKATRTRSTEEMRHLGCVVAGRSKKIRFVYLPKGRGRS